jgi:hypothetical protein
MTGARGAMAIVRPALDPVAHWFAAEEKETQWLPNP